MRDDGGREGGCGEGEADPFDPFAEVVRVGDEIVEHALGDPIIFALLVVGFVSFRGGFPADVEEGLVVEDVSDETCSPKDDADEEERAGVGVGEEGLGWGRGEIGGEREGIGDVEQCATDADDDV